MPGALTKSTWTLQHLVGPGYMASSPHLRQEGFHCPSTTVNLTGTKSLSHHVSIQLVKLSDSARSFQEGWTDIQSLDKQSPNLYFEPELTKVHSGWGIERGLGGFTFSPGLSSPEMVCKGGCWLCAPPNKLLLPCYTMVICPRQIKRLLMISPQGHCLLL